MIFRQLFDAQSSTFTYLLADDISKEAVIIDPVFKQFRRDAALIEELQFSLLYTLDTHLHADHITAAWLFKQRFNSTPAISKQSGAEGAGHYLRDGDKISFGRHKLEARSTPGHTDGCTTFVLDKQIMAFTGDALMIRSAGRTDFQQGDPVTLYRSVHEKIFSLPDDCLVYPAHDYQGRCSSSVWEEKTYNPRLGGQRSEGDFVGYMNNLGLPHPNQIDTAVPANQLCGKPDSVSESQEWPNWAPLSYTYAGIYEVQPIWLDAHSQEVQVLDVRDPAEFDGILGHIDGAILIPLDQLRERCTELSMDKPIVTVCRSGGRSTQAIPILEKQGFSKLANLTGGMIQWRSQNLPVEDTNFN